MTSQYNPTISTSRQSPKTSIYNSSLNMKNTKLQTLKQIRGIAKPKMSESLRSNNNLTNSQSTGRFNSKQGNEIVAKKSK